MRSTALTEDAPTGEIFEKDTKVPQEIMSQIWPPAKLRDQQSEIMTAWQEEPAKRHLSCP